MADHYRGLAQSLVELGFLFRRQGERRQEVWRNRQTNQEVTFDRDEVARSRAAADAVLTAARALLDNPPPAPLAETPEKKPAATASAKSSMRPAVKAKAKAKPTAKPTAKSKVKTKAQAKTPPKPRAARTSTRPALKRK